MRRLSGCTSHLRNAGLLAGELNEHLHDFVVKRVRAIVYARGPDTLTLGAMVTPEMPAAGLEFSNQSARRQPPHAKAMASWLTVTMRRPSGLYATL